MKTAAPSVRVPILSSLCAAASLLAAGCLHEPSEDFLAEVAAAPPEAVEAVVQRDVTLRWEGVPEPAPIAALPASPLDRLRPDPVPFRIGAGHGALGHVDLEACKDEGLPSGYLHMRVTFRRDGRVAHAVVESPTPPSQGALDCIADQLQAAMVPRFDGRDATLSKSLFVEPGDPAEQPGDTVVHKDGAPPRHAGSASAPITRR